MTIRVNEAGIKALREILSAHHKRGDDLTDEQLQAWAAEAEDAFSDCGVAYIEIRSNDARSGNPEIHTLPEDAIDCSTALKVSARHGHDGARDWSQTASELGGRLVGAGPLEKWRFPDGSGVVAVGEAWDVALSGDNDECMCPESEDEHEDGCPLAHPIIEITRYTDVFENGQWRRDECSDGEETEVYIEGFGPWGIDEADVAPFVANAAMLAGQ